MRHKCITEREKPVSEQVGAVQCQGCKQWWRSKGGLAVHSCNTENPDTNQLTNQSTVCTVCERTFSRPIK